MKTKQLTLLLVLLLFCSNTNAQEFKLGKVSIAELEQKKHPKDTAAVAAILFKKGETKFEYTDNDGFRVVTEVTVRVKIYKKEGYSWGNQAVNFRSNVNLKEKVLFSDAVTYNLMAGKIEKTKLKSEGIFEEKIDRYWSKKKITMPNLKEGSVLEYKYSIISNNIGMLNEFNFQTSIPVDYSEYKTYIPEYFIYNTKIKGFFAPKIDVVKSQKEVVIVAREKLEPGVITGKHTNMSTNKFEYEETKTTYTALNIPALKEEFYVNNIENYTSILEQELSMTQYPNEPLKPYATDWNSVVKNIYENEDFGLELNKTGYFEDDLKAIVAGLAKQDEIILAVLNGMIIMVILVMTGSKRLIKTKRVMLAKLI
jgi:hypothetical protein